MKKMICFITLFLICIVSIRAIYINKIGIKLEKNEIALIFLFNENDKTILLKDNNSSYLIVLNGDYNNIKEIGLFGKYDFILSNLNINYALTLNKKINNFIFTTNSNLIKVEYLDQTFCIYSKGKIKDDNCDYYYFLELEDDFMLSERVKLAIYDPNISESIKEKLYTSYVDSYYLKADSYFLIKLNNGNYETVIIPFDNDR